MRDRMTVIRLFQGRRCSLDGGIVTLLPLLMILFSLLWPPLAQAEEDEVQVQQTRIRAAYLHHFLQLVKWPGEEEGQAQSVFNICISGRDPFGEIIEAVARKKARGRTVSIRRLGDARQVERCHILFVGLSPQHSLAEVMKAADQQNVLTVSDIRGFVDKGGMIGFVSVPDESASGYRVRFEINLAVARRHGLVINSKLLELATQVRQ